MLLFFFSARLKLVRLIESTCRMSLRNHVISWAFDTKMAAAFVHSATSWLLLLALRPRPLTLTCPVHVLRCLVGGKAASRDAQAIPDSVLRPFFCQYWQIPSWHPSIGHVARWKKLLAVLCTRLLWRAAGRKLECRCIRFEQTRIFFKENIKRYFSLSNEQKNIYKCPIKSK